MGIDDAKLVNYQNKYEIWKLEDIGYIDAYPTKRVYNHIRQKFADNCWCLATKGYIDQVKGSYYQAINVIPKRAPYTQM